MWKDILIIFVVIISSYIFTLSSIQKFDKQMTFILIQLLVLIIFKMIYYKNNIVNKGIKENFQGGTTPTPPPPPGTENLNLSMVNDWIGAVQNNVQTGKISDNSLRTLSNEANQLQTKLDKVSTEILSLKELITMKDNNNNTNKSIVNTLDTATIQSNQNENLKQLAKDIKSARALLENVSMAQQTKEYPKIPVYSSCIVSNADGGYSLDTPNKDSQNQKNNQVQQNKSNQRISAVSSGAGLVGALTNVFDKGINVKIN
jgi:hypothetical protein